MKRPLAVVIADDSPFVCRLVAGYLEAEAGMRVAGIAHEGRRAVDLVKRHRPDVVTLDLDMPGGDGLAALEEIMLDAPTPAVVITGVSGAAASRTLEALDLGAVDFVLKYSPQAELDPVDLRREIVAKVEAAAKIRVIRSLKAGRASGGAAEEAPAGHDGRIPAPAEPGRHKAGAAAPAPAAPGEPPAVVVIGASTGGPVALRQLLAELPPSFAAAVLVVQHMPPSFTGVLAAQLDRRLALPVRQAREGDRLARGTVLIAPGGFHLLLASDSRVLLRRGPEISGHCPSVDVTMQSAAQLFGHRARGVLLTGMGSDGVAGLAAIRKRGGHTFAQDAASCVVNGMPQRAIERGAVETVASPWEIGELLAVEPAGAWRRQAC
jgi:two-component system chemotaxis response regulator CheB